MKYFTEEWAYGDMSDAMVDKTCSDYLQHIENLLPFLPKSIAILARDTNLHDGLIKHCIINYSECNMNLVLRCGDLQVGYFDLNLSYLGVDFKKSNILNLRKLTKDPNTGIGYDEIDKIRTNIFIHRILFWNYKEIEIVFSSLELERIPKSCREFKKVSNRYKEIK